MSKRILVVEDQEDNRQIVRDLLTTCDYEITEAENGEEALASVAKYRPDLILMDIQLPVMDGYEATRRIKADSSQRPRQAEETVPSVRVTRATSYRTGLDQVFADGGDACCVERAAGHLQQSADLHRRPLAAAPRRNAASRPFYRSNFWQGTFAVGGKF